MFTVTFSTGGGDLLVVSMIPKTSQKETVLELISQTFLPRNDLR